MIGLGCMRLSTEPGRDDDRALAVLAAALDAGVTLLDTADAYAHSDDDIGHNEHLVSRAIAAHATRARITERDVAAIRRDGDARREIIVVTKGGLTRPGGAWVPDGRAKHLAAAARASRERLGVDAIDIYLLHAIDSKTPLATSVRALAKLRDDGIARAIGLSNVTLTQLDDALTVTRIDVVEIELHPWKLDAIRGGLVARCEERGIRVLAHRPLGGPPGLKRATKDKVLVEIAARLDASPHEVVVAWLRALSPAITPIPGATRVETARSAARAAMLVLDDDMRAKLAARFLEVGTNASDRGGELVVIAGMPASGKSMLAEDFVKRGYLRLNRDDRGGSLLELAKAVDQAIAEGADRVVVDNTYQSRSSRAPLVAIAKRHQMAIKCIAVATPIEHAQANACTRMLERHDRLLAPHELGGAGNIAPNVQFRYRRGYEPPNVDEGFIAIETYVPPRIARGTRRAIVVELDGVVWRGRPVVPDAIELLPGAREALLAWRDHVIAGTTWQPTVATHSSATREGAILDDATVDGATREGAILDDATDVTLDGATLVKHEARLRALLGVPIHVLVCTHPAGPPICWCRKPMPGLALALAHAHDIDLARSVHVGKQPSDRGFALRAGMRYVEHWPRPDDELPLPADP